MTNQKSIYSPLGASSHSDYERVKQDYYATHPSAIDHLFEKETFAQEIWEPACGEGHLSKRMEKLGKDVFSTDLIDRGYGEAPVDFLQINSGMFGHGGMVRQYEARDIITNPPYKLAQEFVEKALELIDSENKVAMFLKLTFLESKGRVDFFRKHPPKRIWVFSFRIPVARNGEPEMFKKSSAVCYAWFVWVKGYKGSPKVGWITRKEKQ